MIGELKFLTHRNIDFNSQKRIQKNKFLSHNDMRFI